MSEFVPSLALPAWVKRRDGRVVPFDPDVISQDLFTATEALGRPDVFQARELTDGILHFLAADGSDNIPTTETIADLVVKVVRELRHPRLAQAFADRPRRTGAASLPQSTTEQRPTQIAQDAVKRFTLETVFTRDLTAAHDDGLLLLTGLHAPLELAAAMLAPAGPSPYDRLGSVAEARRGIAGWLVLDSIDYDLWASDPGALVRILPPVLKAIGLTARLQLNSADPPLWALATAAGPLFAEPHTAIDPQRAARDLLDVILTNGSSTLAVDWHLGERDFEKYPAEALEPLARAALDGHPVAFAFDRPRRSVLLGPGMDRKHPALLLTVGLNLPRLLEFTGITNDVEQFMKKLASLARLAVSAAVQKRQYLRKQARAGEVDPLLERGLLLERARLLVAPLGLELAVRTMTGGGLAGSKEALEVGRGLVQQLQKVLETEGRRRLVDCALDAPEDLDTAEVLAGLTTADFRVPARQQLRASGRLHAVTGTGTAVVGFEELPSAEEIAELLTFAWQQTDIARLRFQWRAPVEEQPTFLT